MALAISTIRALFQSQVFDHASITAITSKVYNYDIVVTIDNDLTALMYNQKINFFSYQALRSISYEASSNNGNANDYGYNYEVQISYYLEAENNSNAYNLAIDRMETVEDLIHSELGINWDDNVDVMTQIQTGLPELVTIQDVECWKITQLYSGLKYN